jgi:hypothetical protein
MTTSELSTSSVLELLQLGRATIEELRLRGVVRSGNAPAGDYAEWLAAERLPGTLAGRSERSWDVLTESGERIQVKARVVADPKDPGQRQLSVLRSFDFDWLLILLFDDKFRVWRAVKVLPAAAELSAYRSEHVNGYVLYAKDSLLDDPATIDLADMFCDPAPESFPSR